LVLIPFSLLASFSTGQTFIVDAGHI